MKNQELYQRSVDILLDAYNEKRLVHGNDCECAVGNLVRANGGASGGWFCPMLNYKEMVYREIPDANVKFKEKIEMTGYTINEIVSIEAAFESKSWVDEKNRTQYFGLCAVLDVLRKIHEVDTDSHEENQTKLTAIYNKFQLA